MYFSWEFFLYIALLQLLVLLFPSDFGLNSVAVAINLQKCVPLCSDPSGKQHYQLEGGSHGLTDSC